MSLSKVAIIGTGITALSIGHYLPLVNPLVQITFFEKGQKPGGRVATRRSRQKKQLLFDHGAPFLWDSNIKGDLRDVLNELNAAKEININIAKTQSLKGNNFGEIVNKKVLIGRNGLDSVPQAIFKSIKNVKGSHFEHRVIGINKTNQNNLTLSFQQTSNQQMTPFNQVFCCIPFPQAKSLKQQLVSFEPFNNIKSNYYAHWIVLVSTKKGQLFDEYKDSDVIEFKNKDSPIKYAVKQNKKFEQLKDSEVENWAVYFTEKWTQENLELTKEEVQEKFLKQVLPMYCSNEGVLKPQFITVHRWLYSSPKAADVIKSPLISADKRLVFAGDWVGNRQSVGECWALGKEIVEQLYGSVVANKSKL